MIDKQLRIDMIHEKMRSPLEIRKSLARCIKDLRSLNNKQARGQLIAMIAAFKYVLRHDVSPQQYYEERYKK